MSSPLSSFLNINSSTSTAFDINCSHNQRTFLSSPEKRLDNARANFQRLLTDAASPDNRVQELRDDSVYAHARALSRGFELTEPPDELEQRISSDVLSSLGSDEKDTLIFQLQAHASALRGKLTQEREAGVARQLKAEADMRKISEGWAAEVATLRAELHQMTQSHPQVELLRQEVSSAETALEFERSQLRRALLKLREYS